METGHSNFLLKQDNAVLGNALEFATRGFFSATKLLANRPHAEWSDEKLNISVNECFWQNRDLVKGNHDPHLVMAPYNERRSGFSVIRTDEVESNETRASLLLKSQLSAVMAFEFKVNNRSQSNTGPVSQYLPSHLYFARHYLTSPEFLASEGYAHAVVRAEIFRQALMYETSEGTDLGVNAYRRIREAIAFSAVVSSLQKIERHSANRDTVHPSNITDFIVFQLLASRGIVFLKFSESPNPNAGRSSDKNRSSRSEYLNAGALHWQNSNYEFRVSDRVRRLPSAAELMNELDGTPIPIPGASTIFQNGLRFTRKEGLVGRVYGEAGTGKTSFALGVAASLAPLGTRTLFISAEERPEDLTDRLTTLVPPFIRRTKSFDSDTTTWFDPQFLGPNFRGSPYKVIAQLKTWLDAAGGAVASDDDCPPGLTPLLVVLDGVHEFYNQRNEQTNGESSDHISDLIDACREFGALVLLMSSSGKQNELVAMDYLVDFVLELEHNKVAEVGQTPERRLTLRKTRRQVARPGSHVFHLSKSKGFRISPDIISELDERRRWKWDDPKQNSVFDFLQRGAGSINTTVKRSPLVNLTERSQILILGEGSSGKSTLGLKLLSSPLKTPDREDTSSEQNQEELKFQSDAPDYRIYDEDGDKEELSKLWDPHKPFGRRRCLVLSFLYQEEFYRTAWNKKVQKGRREDLSLKSAGLPLFDFDCIRFAPGHIGPEDFLKVITRKVEGAELSGYPYHGVFIDGLHNVYLQFPNLETSEMIWPLLYEYFRLQGLTVVTTHTSFKIQNSTTQTAFDIDASRRRIGPLLHALVQAADYTLQVMAPEAVSLYLRGEKVTKEKLTAPKILSKIVGSTSLETARSGATDYFWDREKAIFYEKPK